MSMVHKMDATSGSKSTPSVADADPVSKAGPTRHAGRQAGRQAARQAGRQAGMQAGRQVSDV
jgi:hypothetical protein